MNTELDVIRVTKIHKPKEESAKPEAWKEEIGSMEQFLSSLSALREEKGIFHRLIYDVPSISFEIANFAKSDEITFFISVPRKFRESIEKQIHSFFPHASLEKSKDFNIFHPQSYTASAVLKLKNRYILPIKTYENMEVDPLNAITNSLSKLDVEKEGAAFQVILKPTGKHWRMAGRTTAQKMQQGHHLGSVHSSSAAIKMGKEAGFVIHDMLAGKGKSGKPDLAEPKHIQLTPEEQELVKSLEQKSSKTGFEVNVRLVASAAAQERAEQILAQMENSFTQFENSDTNCFKVAKRMNKKDIEYDFIFRNFDMETATILNVEEIASIFHFPISVTETPKWTFLPSVCFWDITITGESQRPFGYRRPTAAAIFTRSVRPESENPIFSRNWPSRTPKRGEASASSIRTVMPSKIFWNPFPKSGRKTSSFSIRPMWKGRLPSICWNTIPIIRSRRLSSSMR
jgi:hypothetical protein